MNLLADTRKKTKLETHQEVPFANGSIGITLVATGTDDSTFRAKLDALVSKAAVPVHQQVVPLLNHFIEAHDHPAQDDDAQQAQILIHLFIGDASVEATIKINLKTSIPAGFVKAILAHSIAPALVEAAATTIVTDEYNAQLERLGFTVQSPLADLFGGGMTVRTIGGFTRGFGG